MKTTGLTLFFIVFAVVLIFGSSCSPKYGCPSGAVGAEQLLSGEKVKKQKKFKAYPIKLPPQKEITPLYNHPKSYHYEPNPPYRFWLHGSHYR